MQIKQLIKQYFVNRENAKYLTGLMARKVTYEAWLAGKTQEWKAYAEKASTVSEGELPEIVLVQGVSGQFEPYAIQAFKRFFAENPGCSVCYCDEDAGGENPWFKPDWSPDLLDSRLYTGSCLAVNRTLWEKLHSHYKKIMPGRWEEIFSRTENGSSFLIEEAEPFERWVHHCAEGLLDTRTVMGHLPQILFHADNLADRERFLTETPFLQAKHKERIRVFEDELQADTPCVSVIIPSKDHPEILAACVESLKRHADVPCELIVVDNGSSPENRAAVEQLLAGAREGENHILSAKYLYEQAEFNFSHMCNMGAEAAETGLLLFLNDDVTLAMPVLKEMAVRAEMPGTGAVGLKLLYPDSDRIQHAGIVNLPMGPVHKMQFLSDGETYYANANRGMVNCLAVTAACLMVDKKKFNEIGGFSEALRVAFNDVALCFGLQRAGYSNVCMNNLYAFHHESLSRGDDEAAEKVKRLQGEKEKLYSLYPEYDGKDPYYSVHLNRDGLDVRIRPAYLSAGNTVQTAAPKKVNTLQSWRQDPCLMVRVEDVRDLFFGGYGVVLGDDNACYEKSLVLKKAEDEYYVISLDGQYRQDLEENMPDQKNVALAGFAVQLEKGKLPEGSYLLGMLARNRVTGMKLANFSKREIEIRSNHT